MSGLHGPVNLVGGTCGRRDGLSEIWGESEKWGGGERIQAWMEFMYVKRHTISIFFLSLRDVKALHLSYLFNLLFIFVEFSKKGQWELMCFVQD